MKYAIIYDTKTFNTEMLAEEIKDLLFDDVIYFGKVDKAKDIVADVYFVGSPNYMDDATNNIKEYLKSLNNAKVFYFATSGYLSDEYEKHVIDNVKNNLNDSNTFIGHFMCKGKMPMYIKEKYGREYFENPSDEVMKKIENWNDVLNHPDLNDLTNLKNKLKHYGFL